MLCGTSWRFSVRLRAVTTISPSKSEPLAAAAIALVNCIAAAPESTAAIAMLSLEGGRVGAATCARTTRLDARSLAIALIKFPTDIILNARACVSAPRGSSLDWTAGVNDLRIGEALHAIAEAHFQRLEFFLEVSPVADPRGIERLAHLFGTRGANRTLCLVEIQARRLERQIAMREQPADVRFGISDQVLVLNAHGFARQHGVPVFHERQ